MASYSSVILAEPGLQAYWKLDELAFASAMADAATTPDNGTYVNTAGLTFGVTPTGINTNTPANTAVDFLASSLGHATIPDANKLDMTTAFTIECWIRVDLTLPAGAFRTMFTKLLTGATVQGNYSFYLTNPSGGASTTVTLEGEIRGSTLSTANSTTTFAFGLGVWHQVAMVFNGSTVQFYADGATLGSAVAAVQTMVATTTAGALGRYGTGTDYFDGAIDEVSVYNTALSGATINAHYVAGTTAPGPSLAITDTQATASWVTGSASKVTASPLTWNAGDLIVYIAGCEGVATLAVPTAPGLTFASVRVNGAGSTCAAQLAVATAVSGGSQIITGTNSSATLHWGFEVWAVGPHNGAGTSALQVTTAHTVNVTPTAADSMYMWGGFDFGAAGAPTAVPTATHTPQSIDDGTQYSLMVADLVDQVTGGVVAYGVVSPSAAAVTLVVLEVLAPAGSGVLLPRHEIRMPLGV